MTILADTLLNADCTEAMTATDPYAFYDSFHKVAASRLASGAFNGDRHTGEGDIYASYSADLIAMAGKVRTPFRHASHLWTCISMSWLAPGAGQFEAYRLTPQTLFPEPCTTYPEKVRIEGGEAARKDPHGFYHGMTVEHGGARYALTGPPEVFVADPSADTAPEPQQLSLF